MTGFEVAVTGLGLNTAAGVGVEASWRGVCAGRSASTSGRPAMYPV